MVATSPRSKAIPERPSPTGNPPRWTWADVEAYLARHWNPGQHVAIIGPTEYGKTYLAAALLGLWEYTLALDIKGDGDPSVGKLGRKVDAYPTRYDLRRDDAHHYVVSPGYGRWGVHGDALARAWSAGKAKGSAGGWTVYVDEILLATQHGLGEAMRHYLVAGRSRGLTLVGSNQAARDIPREFYDQPRWHFFGNLRDDRVLYRVMEIGSGDKNMIRNVIPTLDEEAHEWLLLGPNRFAVRTVVGK
jgi:hypothetical protein